MERGAVIFGGDVQQGSFKILRLLPQVLIFFLVEKWIPPSRLEIVEIGQNTKGILGVKEHFTSIVGLEGNRGYNRQSLQLRNNGFWV
jgi:hypothetical protein